MHSAREPEQDLDGVRRQHITRSQPKNREDREPYIGSNECIHILSSAGDDSADETEARSPNNEPSPAKLVRQTAKKKHGNGTTTSPDDGEQAGVVTRPWNPR